MSSLTDPKAILLRGDPIAYEAKAGGAITPGHILALGADGVVSVSGASAATRIPTLVARENEVVGGGIDDAYAAADRVLYYHLRPGDEFYGILATGANVATGAALTYSAGVLAAAGGNYVIAQAMEAVNNTTGAPVRIRARAI